MSKAKKVLDEARETHNPELDLADKGLSSFEELPGLCKYQNKRILKELYGFLHFWVNLLLRRIEPRPAAKKNCKLIIF